jgi:hypothetical protein
VQLPAVLKGRLASLVVLVGAIAFCGVARGDNVGTTIHVTFSNGSVLHSAPGNERVPIQGVLEQGGHGVPGATVMIDVAPAGGAPAAVGTAVTDKHGDFKFLLPAGGPRTVAVVLGSTVSNGLTVEQGTHIGLKVSPDRVRPGGRVTFTGQIVGVSGPAVLVQLQVRKGAAYQTFLVVRSQPDGSFRGGFRFSSVKARYRFRALVVAQTGFAFARSTSNLVAVTVR